MGKLNWTELNKRCNYVNAKVFMLWDVRPVGRSSVFSCNYYCWKILAGLRLRSAFRFCKFWENQVAVSNDVPGLYTTVRVVIVRILGPFLENLQSSRLVTVWNWGQLSIRINACFCLAGSFLVGLMALGRVLLTILLLIFLSREGAEGLGYGADLCAGF